MGRLSCSGLLDMGREKKGRSVTWVAKGGRGRKRETGQISSGVNLCLISGERHGPDGGGVDLKFRLPASLSLTVGGSLSLSLSLLVRFFFFFSFFFPEMVCR